MTAESNPGFDVFGSKLVNAVDPTLLDGAGDVYHMSGRCGAWGIFFFDFFALINNKVATLLHLLYA